MKSLRILLALAFFLVVGYFLGELTGKIYFDPLCKRYGEPLGYTYTGYSIHYRSSPAECHYRDADGYVEHVELGEIPKQFMDYVRGTVQWILLMGGLVGVVALTKMIGGVGD